MENFIKEFDIKYRSIIGDYNVELARGFIPVSYHGSQVKDEFTSAWYHIINYLEKLPQRHITFLEIGAYKGLWPLMFSEVCNYLEKTPVYTTVTLLGQDINNAPLLNVKKYYEENEWEFNLIDANSIFPSTKDNVLEYHKSYNLVFIDADHRYEFAKQDIELYSPLCTDIQIFHDVKPRIATADVGVWKAIEELNIELDMEFSTNELNYGLGLKFYNLRNESINN